jgi:hypothetical protein
MAQPAGGGSAAGAPSGAGAPGAGAPGAGAPPGLGSGPGSGGPGFSATGSMPRPPQPDRRGSRRAIWVAIAVLLIIVAAGVTTLLLNRRSDGHPAPADSQSAPAGQPTPPAGQPTPPVSRPTPSAGTSGRPTAPATVTPGKPELIPITREAFVHQDVDQVVQRLQQMGFPTEVQPDNTSAGRPGEVTQIAPYGMIPIGTKITIFAIPKYSGATR